MDFPLNAGCSSKNILCIHSSFLTTLNLDEKLKCQWLLVDHLENIISNSSDELLFCLQSEIHELLALVYYDSLQNVVPFYDQRSVVPSRDAAWTMFCQNSMKHFEKAFAHK